MDIALLDALASPYFKSLTNHGHQWCISYVDEHGNVGQLSSKNMDKLLSDWVARSEEIWTRDYERRQEREMERRMLHG